MLIDAVAERQHRSVDLLRLTPSGGREAPPPPRGGPLPMHSHRAAPRRRPSRHNGRQIANHHLYASSCQTRRDTPRNLQKDATEPAPRKTLHHRRQTHPRPTKPPSEECRTPPASPPLSFLRDAILRRPEKTKEGERRKKYVILRSAERRACGGCLGWWVGCAALGFASAASRLHCVG
jgi:hypothetical protein